MIGTRRSWLQCLALALTLQLSVIAGEFFKPFNVSYDHRALIIDGKRRMLNSAGIHYPRTTPQVYFFLLRRLLGVRTKGTERQGKEILKRMVLFCKAAVEMWPDLIAKSKVGQMSSKLIHFGMDMNQSEDSIILKGDMISSSL
ncbi:Beta-galactosidase 9 [Camellia lanceoleosa]|uniref:Beta-galactosidase 9 n=1 Tax=Camellia lanceoleosa TaxID=1840588 RepID=A0ACC0GRB1_9ERIC|nr:Beta-galactosidase 9 [Camellia lanceoleosa]